MQLLHYLTDTNRKREDLVLLVFIFMLFYECVTNAFLMLQMSSIQVLEDLYNLMNVAQYSFIGRIILQLYSASTYSFSSIILSIVQSISLNQLGCIIGCFYFLCSSYNSLQVRSGRRITLVVVLFNAFIYCTSCYLIYQCLTMASYNSILLQVKLVGILTGGAHVLEGVLLLIISINIMNDFLVALTYRAIEIEDIPSNKENE